MKQSIALRAASDSNCHTDATRRAGSRSRAFTCTRRPALCHCWGHAIEGASRFALSQCRPGASQLLRTTLLALRALRAVDDGAIELILLDRAQRITRHWRLVRGATVLRIEPELDLVRAADAALVWSAQLPRCSWTAAVEPAPVALRPRCNGCARSSHRPPWAAGWCTAWPPGIRGRHRLAQRGGAQLTCATPLLRRPKRTSRATSISVAAATVVVRLTLASGQPVHHLCPLPSINGNRYYDYVINCESRRFPSGGEA